MRIAIALAVVLLLSTVVCAVPTGRFDYSQERLNSREVAQKEFGENLLEGISKQMDTPGISDKKWRRAVASVAFTGAEGVDMLLKRINPLLKSKNHNWKTQAMLETLGNIQDRRSLQISADVLVSDAPVDLKSTAMDIVVKLAESMDIPATATITSSDGQSVTLSLPVSFTWRSDRPTYSRGQELEFDDLINLHARLVNEVYPTLSARKDCPKLTNTLKEAVKIIAKRYDEIRKAREATIERYNSQDWFKSIPKILATDEHGLARISDKIID